MKIDKQFTESIKVVKDADLFIKLLKKYGQRKPKN
jgi:hypothetical protein